jgi:hypothetical protein
LFNNPSFNEEARKKWDTKRYFEDKSYFTDPKLVRPYLVGMSCGFCHVRPIRSILRLTLKNPNGKSFLHYRQPVFPDKSDRWLTADQR